MAAAIAAAPAMAADGDLGFQGFSFAPVGGSPTGSKPESKLWFNDGSWWAAMIDPVTLHHHIFRLNRASELWQDTAVDIDPRRGSREDVLWDAQAGKLYVTSNQFTETPHAQPKRPRRLSRYSYDPANGGTYTLDLGFPVAITGARSETLVIAKDSTGTLWATWAQGNAIMVAHSVGSDDVWSAPYVIPAASAQPVGADDISSIIAFAGNKVGVIWSNHDSHDPTADQHDYFSVHVDGTDDSATSWSTTQVPLDSGFPAGQFSDDHFNLKTDSTGKVYALVKHSTDTSPPSTPFLSLLTRSKTGTWKRYTAWRLQDQMTRGIVELDEQHRVIHMFATGPQPPAKNGQSGGTIYEKATSMDDISIPVGLGTPVIRDITTPQLNNSSSTKQNVDAATGLVVLAGNDATSTYWHADESVLTALPAPTQPPTAAFTTSPIKLTARAPVTFNDRSADPDDALRAYAWDLDNDGQFDDATGPTVQRTFAAAGTYTVGLQVTDAHGGISTPITGVVTVGPATNNTAPTARFTSSPSYPQTGAAVMFTSTSSDPDAGDPLTYAWDLNDDGLYDDGTGATASRTFAEPGDYYVHLLVTDGSGATSTANAMVTVTDPPPPPDRAPTASFTVSPQSPRAGRAATFTSNSSDPDAGDRLTLEWDLDGDAHYDDGGANSVTRAFTSAGPHVVRLRVTDSRGTSATATQTITVTAGSSIDDREGNGGSGVSTGGTTPPPPPPPPTGRRVVIATIADAQVRSASPRAAGGRLRTAGVWTRTRSSSRVYLKFRITGLSGPVTGGKLRLVVRRSAARPGAVRVFAMRRAWSERTITWARAPRPSAGRVAAGRAALRRGVMEIDLPRMVFRNGTYTLLLTGVGGSGVVLGTRESHAGAQLVLNDRRIR